jgi:hypothetical protein
MMGDRSSALEVSAASLSLSLCLSHKQTNSLFKRVWVLRGSCQESAALSTVGNCGGCDVVGAAAVRSCGHQKFLVGQACGGQECLQSGSSLGIQLRLAPDGLVLGEIVRVAAR